MHLLRIPFSGYMNLATKDPNENIVMYKMYDIYFIYIRQKMTKIICRFFLLDSIHNEIYFMRKSLCLIKIFESERLQISFHFQLMIQLILNGLYLKQQSYLNSFSFLIALKSGVNSKYIPGDHTCLTYGSKERFNRFICYSRLSFIRDFDNVKLVMYTLINTQMCEFFKIVKNSMI